MKYKMLQVFSGRRLHSLGEGGILREKVAWENVVFSGEMWYFLGEGDIFWEMVHELMYFVPSYNIVNFIFF